MSRFIQANYIKASIIALSVITPLATPLANAKEATSRGSNSEVLPESTTSPARRIERRSSQPGSNRTGGETSIDTRTYDGSNNNLNDTHMGATHVHLARFAAADYADGISAVGGENRGSARLVSNLVFSQSDQVFNTHHATDMLWQWGQFLDHDIDLTDGVTPTEPANIIIPTGDIFFDPDATGTQTMALNRSIYDVNTGTGPANPRQQINEITAWIDASNVYGSSQERANALRTLDGTGKLKTSDGNLLPFNETGLENAGGSGSNLFLAGDVRANEQVGLTVMHTLFVREHNRLASKIARNHPSFSGEEIYQQARRLVAAQMQKITFDEFLPVMLGRKAIREYKGYQAEVSGNIHNEFSTAAYRLGHSLLSPTILRLDQNLEVIPQGHLSLRNAFFAPQEVIENDIDSVLRGLATQQCQSIDTFVIDDVRNFLFGRPGSGGFDLVALNIQRGRDHGLASYNDVREALGLARFTQFEQITTNTELQDKLKATYSDVNSIDLWVGGLAEDHYKSAMVGELFYHIIRNQFEALRDADRFWYERDLNREDREYIEKTTTLAKIIRRNTDIGREIPKNVFLQKP